jgi:two-component system nitrate/nitrite response regulator NarL
MSSAKPHARALSSGARRSASRPAAESVRAAAGGANGNGARSTIRILIADRETVFRIGLGKIFDAEPDLRVVAQAQDGAEALALVERLKPDVVFVQRDLLGDNPTPLLVDLRRASPASKIMLTASVFNEEEAVTAVKCSASGVILRSTDPALFVRCARKVVDNEIWLPKKQVAQIAKLLDQTQAGARPVDLLTARERLVISYLILGWRNREIAERMSITEQTVKNHLRSIYDKVGVSDRLELVLFALHRRLELPPAA